MQPFSYQPSAPRPRFPEYRPYTVHSSSPTFVHDAAEADSFEDDQPTPRASVAGQTSLTEHVGKRLSRDDTARDVSLLSGLPGPVEPQEQLDQWSEAHAFSQPRTWRNHNVLWSGSVQNYQPNGPLPDVSASATTNPGKQTIRRKFSRKYNEKFSELKDGISRHATLPGRLRRASTPHNVEANTAPPGTIDPRQLIAPLSPSKRNATRGFEPRARKFGKLLQGDRKDTPAPPASASGTVRPPMMGTVPAMQGWQYGGEGARKAAAAAKQLPLLFGLEEQLIEDDFNVEQEQRHLRRSRIGSLSSAADSGADLGHYDESREDSVADGEEMDVDEMGSPSAKPAKQDFVKALPNEIVLSIFEYLDAKDLLQAQQVARSWWSMVEENSVWRTAYLRKFDRQIFTNPAPIQVGGVGAGRINKPNQEWKRMYMARLELERNWRRGPRVAGKAIYLSGHTDSVYCLQFDEEKIITGSRDRTIRVWDINTFQCIHVIGGPNMRPTLGPKVLRTVDYPAFHLATASVNGTAYGDSIYQVPSDWHDASILCLQYDDKILVTGSSDSDLLVWDIKTYQPIRRLRKHTGGVLDVALDSKHIVSCSKDSRIIVWDRETYEPKGELTGHRGPVNAVQLRGKYLVSASGDGIARLWDLDQMKLIKQFSAKERGLAAVEFSEDMKYVLAGGNDHITYKFDVETGEEVMQFTGHSQLVRSLWLDSANNRVVSGSYDLDLRVYDFVTGQEIWRAEEWTTSWMLAAKSDYRRIVATSQDGRILMVDFGLKKGGLEDGQPIDDIDLLRGTEHTTAIQFMNPFVPGTVAR